MKLGEKLKQARLEAGLSQRQLCDGAITRNMLSLIENGASKPSMDTLTLLAARLGKPVSWFLEEAAVSSPNQECMRTARQLYDQGRCPEAARELEDYQPGDDLFDREEALLRGLSLLSMAEQAIGEQRERYALELLEKVPRETAYCGDYLERQRLLLLGRLGAEAVSSRLPSLDEELLLRAREALTSGDPDRAGRLLDAAEDQDSPRWNLLRGQVYACKRSFRKAAQCLRQAEAAFPAQCIPLLERCYRELEDYKRAYEYACKNR